MTVNQDAQDKEIQRAVMEVVTAYSMVHIHEQHTRGNNQLDIVLTTNSSLIKSSNNATGISDHDMVVTDCDTKPYYQRKRPCKCYVYSKANWDNLHEDLTKLSSTIINIYHTGSSVQNLWDIFKTELFEYLDKHIPSKSHLPWINYKIRKMFKKKTRLYHQAKTNKWKNYKHFQKECKGQ